MMKILLLAVLVASALAQDRATDSSFVDDGGLNALFHVAFYYHDVHDLLLTVTPDSCFYTRIIERDNYEKTLIDHKQQVEFFIGTHMINQDRRHSTTLADMASQYGDLLADFHCIDKHVYTLDISKDELNDLSQSHGGHFDWGSLLHIG